MKNLQKSFIAPLLIMVVVLLMVFGGVYLYKNQKPSLPDLVIENVTLVPNGMTVTIKNIGKKDTIGPIYLCTTDMGDVKYKMETAANFTCGHFSLINMNPDVADQYISIKAGESIDVWNQSGSYYYPLYIAVDKTNEPKLNNLINESDETNNLYIIKSLKDVTTSQVEINKHASTFTPSQIQSLVKCASDLSDMEKHRECRDQLSNINVPSQFDQIFNLLSQIKTSKDISNSREPILFAISNATSPLIVSSLVKHVNDPEKDVREASIEGLGKIASSESIAALLDVIKNGSSEKSVSAKIAIQNAVLADKSGTVVTTLSSYVFGENSAVADTALHGIVISPNLDIATRTLQSLSNTAQTQSQKAMIQKAISDRQKFYHD
jgi:hypothetical protein